jgi:GNAT superfamily N-acetyltransferase
MVMIRPLQDADVEAVAEVHVRTWRSAYAGIIPADYLASLDPVQFAKRRRSFPVPPGAGTVVAADDDGTIVGFATFGPARLAQGTEYDRTNAELYAIYVDPDHQGAGTGRHLLTAARAALKAAGFPRMWLWVLAENHPSRRFYEHLGMTADGTTHLYTPRGTSAKLPEVRYAVEL